MTRIRPQSSRRTGRNLGHLGVVIGLAPVLILANFLLLPPNGFAQAPTPGPQAPAPGPGASLSGSDLQRVPAVNLFPGGVPPRLDLQSPQPADAAAIQRGMQDFNQFNCVGCHAANGAGGMGPSLSDPDFRFGDSPAQLFNVITHGAPLGMPAWGSTLPPTVIWDLVAYIRSISQQPKKQWGTTTSLANFKAAQEQVPAVSLQSTDPWNHLQPFSFGLPPTPGQSTAPLASSAPLPGTGQSQ
jgi:cytochrome c oxidase cbb3-type subunit 3